MRNGSPGRAPNYTTPALIMGAINLFWFLGVIWAIWGFLPVLVIAALLNWGITRIAERRA